MKNIPEQDEMLAQAISNTLDKSLDGLDELSQQRLKNARAAALAQAAAPKPTISHRRALLGMAAAFALLLLTPLVWQQQTTPSPVQDIEMALQEIPLTAEELDDLDMLMALEDTDV